MDNQLFAHECAKPLFLLDSSNLSNLQFSNQITVNTSTGKSLVDKVLETGKKPAEIVKELGLGLVSDEGAIREVCAKIVDANPKEAASYRGGKEALIGWFVGQVMKEMRGKADPELAKTILTGLLNG